jgi:hypothetical protein
VECRIRRQVCSIMQLDKAQGGGFVVCAEHWEPRDYAKIMKNEDKVVNTYNMNGSKADDNSDNQKASDPPPVVEERRKDGNQLKSTVLTVLLTAIIAMFVSLLMVHYSAATIAEMVMKRGRDLPLPFLCITSLLF